MFGNQIKFCVIIKSFFFLRNTSVFISGLIFFRLYLGVNVFSLSRCCGRIYPGLRFNTWRHQDCAFIQILICWVYKCSQTIFIYNISKSSQSSMSAFILNDLFKSAGFQTANWVLPILSEIKEIIARSFVFCCHFVYRHASGFEYLSMVWWWLAWNRTGKRAC